ncbi:MAG: glycoside hydrolase family 44 protein, partial [Clostridia bacterium]
INKDLVEANFVKMPIPSDTADYYLEIGFKEGAGLLQPDAKVGVNTFFYKNDWSSFNQRNDYSFTNSSQYQFSEKVTGYVAGALNWGVEPPLLDIPAFPLNITGNPQDRQVELTWDAVEGATSYDVQADGDFVYDLTSTSYVHNYLLPGTYHIYKVRTKSGSKVSLWSAPLTVKTTGLQELPAPTNVKAEVKADSIKITWNPMIEIITGYDIEVDGSIIDLGMNTSYEHMNLVPGVVHKYRVRAKDGMAIGKWSEPITANISYIPTGPFNVNFTIDTSAEREEISPYIYGANEDLSGTENLTARRMGGNRMSTYNWENNASNAGKDYGFRSDHYVPWYYGEVPWGGNFWEPGVGVSGFHQKSLQKGAYSLVTVPTAGYVAADVDGPLYETPPSSRWKQVKAVKGAPLSLTPDLTDDYVYSDEFVNLMVNKFGDASTPTGINGYELDNEPGLWFDTHKYMHPENAGASEVLKKGLAAAKAIRSIDPYAEIFGPVTYGFDELYSMYESPEWYETLKGNYDWYADYYLDKFRIESEKEGTRLLNSMDIHFYTEETANNQKIVDSGSNNDLEANKKRMQTPRQLWDPTYKENSYIGRNHGKFLPLLPRIKESIDKYYPGTKLSVTEYNLGGENNVYGGIGYTDLLGIFGKQGVYLATFWKMDSTVDHKNNPTYVSAALKLFTNYDGNNSKYGDLKVQADTSDIENSSIYGSVFKDSDNNLHLIVLNKNNDYEMIGNFQLNGGTTYKTAKVYAFDSNSSAITEREGIAQIIGNTFTYTIPKLTAAHIVLSAE